MKIPKSKKVIEGMVGINKIIGKVKNKQFHDMLVSVLKNNEKNLTDKNTIKFEKIIEAMIAVDRKYFAPFDVYVDEPVIIGKGQTISQPTTVARMLLMLDLKKGHTILESGTGSGWNSSLLSYLVNPGKVITAERIFELSKLARKNISDFTKKTRKKLNVKVVFADILDEKTEVWKYRYDRMMITAGVRYDDINVVKAMGIKLLKENGMLLFPSSEIGSYGALELWQKKKNELRRIERDEGYAFVPLLRKIEE